MMVSPEWLCILIQTTWCGFGPKTCDTRQRKHVQNEQ